MSPVAREILDVVQPLAPQDRTFGIQKMLERFVAEGRISPPEAIEILQEVRLLAV